MEELPVLQAQLALLETQRENTIADTADRVAALTRTITLTNNKSNVEVAKLDNLISGIQAQIASIQ